MTLQQKLHGKRFVTIVRKAMSLMNQTLLMATGSFGLGSARSMLEKAAREYLRCKDATSDDDRRDAAINCAISLWHMNDWVWAGITVASRSKPEVLQLLGVTGAQAKKDDLVRWATTRCPELDICQSICNGSKHVVCKGITEARMKPTLDDAQVPPIEIVDGMSVRDGMDVLLTALTFWSYHASNDGVLR